MVEDGRRKTVAVHIVYSSIDNRQWLVTYRISIFIYRFNRTIVLFIYIHNDSTTILIYRYADMPLQYTVYYSSITYYIRYLAYIA